MPLRPSTYSVKYQIQGYTNGDNIEGLLLKADGLRPTAKFTDKSHPIVVTVDGSAIDVQIKSGAAFGYDFALRTNADVDKTITDKGVTMAVTGANWRTNGFVSYLGQNAFRIAENMRATILTISTPNRPTKARVMQSNSPLLLTTSGTKGRIAHALL